MTPNEIERVLRENIGKVVSVVFLDGERENLLVHNVDQEGFVNDPASNLMQPPPCAFWARFADIAEVLPLTSAPDGHTSE
jgi:hypothetical protein